jgi:two-component system phosphate regulon sensor histidine kinase PhoR
MRKPVQSQTEVEEAVATPAQAPPATGEISYSREQLEPLFEHAASALVVIDEQFQVLDSNVTGCEKLGWTHPSIVGQHCSKVLGCMNLNRMMLCGTSSCPLTRVLQKNVPIPNEELICGTLPDHTDEYAVSVTPIKAEGRRIVVFSAREVSSLKVANRVRSNFVSMVSHELRTPLNSVHGFIDLLMQGHMGELTQEQKTYLGYTQEGVQQLVSIVEDILLMTRSDSGQFDIKPEKVNFLNLANQVLRNLQPQAFKASVILNKDIFSPSPLLYVDPQRMKQVLNNLVVNAIKFTPPGGSVTLRARPYDQDFVMISVLDTGYGIPPEDRNHVFERFYQSNHALQSRMGGYGLGLPIARLIVEQHGGVIDFDSTINQGTTFYFTAPSITK